MEPVNLEGLPENPLLLVDSAPIIYELENHPKFAPIFKPVFDAHDKGLARFAVTTITLAEVLAGPLGTGDQVLAERYKATLKSWFVVDLDADIAESTARLRSALKMKLADAVQAASALAIGADAMISHDRDFSALKDLKVLGVD
jgi:predicted nucleic acid-binding protein